MSTYPRHKFTGEVAYRIDALYCAAGNLDVRAELYAMRARPAQCIRAMRGATRLRQWACGHLVRALSEAELSRFGEIVNAQHAATQARRKAA